MGLIKAAVGSGGGVLADQWKEFFVCDSIAANVLVKKGEKRVTGRSSNRKGSDNFITNGSGVIVHEGQCMMIVDQGEIVEFCAEPGHFTYDSKSSPTVFEGGFGQGIKDSFKMFGKRFTYGGDTGKDQRVYYFNTKEIVGNKYGTVNPIPFRVVDRNIGLDVDIAVRCHGEYSYRLVDPILFYKNVSGNVETDYSRDTIENQLRSELLTALQPAFAKISEMGVRYSAIPSHTSELSQALNEVLSSMWEKLRGIKISSFGVSSITASEDDEKMIKELQKSAVLKDPTMAAAALTEAQAAAMKSAAANEGAGAFMAFAGMNMAQNVGGGAAKDLFALGNEQKKADDWKCSCGTENKGNFCSNCGNPKDAGPWKCSCGTENKGNFCGNCGKPKK
ncbi:MAG TPA: SPFH domain-containing protein [Oscillospiraceae bacterium]|nr:SPFH domain-containing protein [Oscillospiraceae bacterium]